ELEERAKAINERFTKVGSMNEAVSLGYQSSSVENMKKGLKMQNEDEAYDIEDSRKQLSEAAVLGNADKIIELGQQMKVLQQGGISEKSIMENNEANIIEVRSKLGESGGNPKIEELLEEKFEGLSFGYDTVTRNGGEVVAFKGENVKDLQKGNKIELNRDANGIKAGEEVYIIRLSDPRGDNLDFSLYVKTDDGRSASIGLGYIANREQERQELIDENELGKIIDNIAGKKGVLEKNGNEDIYTYKDNKTDLVIIRDITHYNNPPYFGEGLVVKYKGEVVFKRAGLEVSVNEGGSFNGGWLKRIKEIDSEK
ncbi:MAG: hypothetical protein U0946_04510, partial [Patescibacteria group bacterium]|nr:hypothetical protein [Patescibacteria group bacterium]